LRCGFFHRIACAGLFLLENLLPLGWQFDVIRLATVMGVLNG